MEEKRVLLKFVCTKEENLSTREEILKEFRVTVRGNAKRRREENRAQDRTGWIRHCERSIVFDSVASL